MMKGFGLENIDTAASYSAATRASNDGSIFVRSYTDGGMTANTPYVLIYGPLATYPGFTATALAVSLMGIVGVPEAAVAAGCVGWVQIRGPVVGVQGGNASSDGSFGDAVYWATGVLKCTGDQYTGETETLGQCGVLTEDISGGASTTMNMFLMGDLLPESTRR